MREWQQTRQREYVMPDAVYYQSIWAVRDLKRMEHRLDELEAEPRDEVSRSFYVSDGKRPYQGDSTTERSAIEKVILESRVRAIREALSVVPENYREAVLLNVAEKKSNYGYTTKIWKLWKQRFLFQVAKNLSLM
ncbi:hypothetical protein [Eubacterium sp. AB3007]|uniref:hypothetical protein n=1 Tax=Eubacterium sp. AB3007 TaxID=1392487 RepID=UPI000486A3F0|nr:hypothetical protein [Eubacterium sp. AB3007]MBQ1472113.1 hypothetical protein [Eubacterium sp.]